MKPVAGRRPRRHGAGVWCWILVSAAVAFGVLAGYFAVPWLAAGGFPVAEDRPRELTRLRRQRAELLARHAELDESLRLEREATAALRQTLDAQAARIAALEKDLAFYRHLARVAAAGDGPLIQDFMAAPAEGDHRFRYRVTLVRPDDSRRNVQGKLSVGVVGSRNGESVHLGGRDLDPDDPHPVNFRYFQVIEGVLQLPAGFEPRTVTVTFRPRKGSSSVRIFSWDGATSPGTAVQAETKEATEGPLGEER